jgi:hypothetical protein
MWRAARDAQAGAVNLFEQGGVVVAALGPDVQRTVRLNGDGLWVEDKVSGRGGCRVGMGWLFAPDLDVREDGGGFLVLRGGTPLLRLTVEGVQLRLHQQSGTPGPGACSSAYGHIGPACQLWMEADVRLPLRVVSEFRWLDQPTGSP